MKRIMPILLLILANTVLMFVMYVITALSLLAVVGVPLALALFAGHVWAASEVQKRFEKRGWLNKPAFLICACAPGIALTVLLSVRLFSSDDGSGLGAVALYIIIYAAGFTAVLGIVLLTRYLRSRR
ncbi:MAG: hypothetical protein ACLSG5_15510 [Oscillospiraceae bacterium]|nr:hypothetical protein [Eubacterium sp.]